LRSKSYLFFFISYLIDRSQIVTINSPFLWSTEY